MSVEPKETGPTTAFLISKRVMDLDQTLILTPRMPMRIWPILFLKTPKSARHLPI